MMRAWLLILLGALGFIAAAADREMEFIGTRGRYWAFQKPVRPAAPEVQSPWVRTPIDAFVLKSLTDKKLTPSPALDRVQPSGA